MVTWQCNIAMLHGWLWHINRSIMSCDGVSTNQRSGSQLVIRQIEMLFLMLYVVLLLYRFQLSLWRNVLSARKYCSFTVVFFFIYLSNFHFLDLIVQPSRQCKCNNDIVIRCYHCPIEWTSLDVVCLWWCRTGRQMAVSNWVDVCQFHPRNLVCVNGLTDVWHSDHAIISSVAFFCFSLSLKHHFSNV